MYAYCCHVDIKLIFFLDIEWVISVYVTYRIYDSSLPLK